MIANPGKITPVFNLCPTIQLAKKKGGGENIYRHTHTHTHRTPGPSFQLDNSLSWLLTSEATVNIDLFNAKYINVCVCLRVGEKLLWYTHAHPVVMCVAERLSIQGRANRFFRVKTFAGHLKKIPLLFSPCEITRKSKHSAEANGPWLYIAVAPIFLFYFFSIFVLKEHWMNQSTVFPVRCVLTCSFLLHSNQMTCYERICSL